MANFTTHIAAGTVVSGALATLTLAADVVAPENLIAVTMAGVLGYSWKRPRGPVTMRYGVHMAFHNLSVHRGIWHSFLAAVFSAAATAVVFYYVLGRHEGVAWLGAGFLFVGFLVHLALDEIYSVDVMDTRIKASFGTALKLFDRRHPYASLGMLAATVAVLSITPPPKTFTDGMASRDMWAGLNQRLLPQGKWFGVIDTNRGLAKVGTAPAADVTTGSIPEPDAASKPAAPTP